MELVCPNVPKPTGNKCIVGAFVDADARDSLIRRSRTGYLVLMNNTHLYWFSKKQSVMERRLFGREFIFMKQYCEYLQGLRYKLRMMDIPVNNPYFIYGENQSV